MGVQHRVIFRRNFDLDGKLVDTFVSVPIVSFELRYL